MRKIFYPILFSFLITGCFDVKKEKTKVQIIEIEEEIEITHHNYFEVEDKMIGWNKMFEVNLTNYFVYFFSPTCSHCSEIKDWIIEQALILKNIYFVKESQNDIISSNISTTIGASSSSQMKILGYPSMIKISNKKVVANCAGRSQIENLLKP